MTSVRSGEDCSPQSPRGAAPGKGGGGEGKLEYASWGTGFGGSGVVSRASGGTRSGAQVLEAYQHTFLAIYNVF